MSHHNFDTVVASDVGVNAAILFENIRYWVTKNKANNKNFRDGLYWTYNSRRAFNELFPYLGEGAIRGALQKLIDAGYVIKGEYNLANYDRTGWYSVPLAKLTSPLVEITSPLANLASRLVENNQPIPVSKPNNKPDTMSGDAATVVSILDYLNSKTNSKYQAVESNAKFIRARLAEGHTVEVIKQVIDVKCAEWLNDKKMKQYLRPKTLFNAENFNSYSGQLIGLTGYRDITDEIA